MKIMHAAEYDKQLVAQRRMIYEMVEASMMLSREKGRHDLEKGCGCIHCVNQRKQIVNGPVKEWKFTL